MAKKKKKNDDTKWNAWNTVAFFVPVDIVLIGSQVCKFNVNGLIYTLFSQNILLHNHYTCESLFTYVCNCNQTTP